MKVSIYFKALSNSQLFNIVQLFVSNLVKYDIYQIFKKIINWD